MMQDTIRQVLEIAIYSGRIMLENGAETYRVEETINRICASQDIHVESFVIPTGIFVSYNHETRDYSYVRRIRHIHIDLEAIGMINDFSRNFVAGKYTPDDAKEQLDKIRYAPRFSTPLVIFFGGLSGGFFTLLFGGSFFEFIAAFLVSLGVMVSSTVMTNRSKSSFMKNLVGGIVNASLALLSIGILSRFGLTANIDMIIIGSIMPLVPGVAITNAIRDLIYGDYVSGMSKLSEALLVAAAIAIGVGIILQLNLLLLGGLYVY
jgi:uncharacterized membrane protein YjjP (DUF1212 family)